MTLKKVAPSSQWASRRMGPRADTLVIAFDAAAGVYYIAIGESPDAHLILDGDQYRIDDSPTGQRARIVRAGASSARILE